MARNGTVDRIESAANITLVISRGAQDGVTYSGGSFSDPDGEDESNVGFIEIPISRLDTTKEVEISEIRESSLKASGYSITAISYSGTMMFKGSRFTKRSPDENQSDEGSESEPITNFIYDDHGVPLPMTVNINHELNDEPERYKHVLATSESYEVRSESETETAFDWVAMDRSTDFPDGSE
jgi:hypothetical protein